jgi:hypothetical protein
MMVATKTEINVANVATTLHSLVAFLTAVIFLQHDYTKNQNRPPSPNKRLLAAHAAFE